SCRTPESCISVSAIHAGPRQTSSTSSQGCYHPVSPDRNDLSDRTVLRVRNIKIARPVERKAPRIIEVRGIVRPISDSMASTSGYDCGCSILRHLEDGMVTGGRNKNVAVPVNGN